MTAAAHAFRIREDLRSAIVETLRHEPRRVIAFGLIKIAGMLVP